MAKSDPEALAAALRENLKKRKERMRAARDSGQAIESFGSDEEGDVPMPEGGSRDGAWVNIGSKKT
jgi:hypothetical protein